jgi:hypothetical protein
MLRGHESRPHCHDTVLRYTVTLQVCNHPKNGTDRLSRNVGNYQSTLPNIPRISFRPRWKPETTQICASYEDAWIHVKEQNAIKSVHVSLYWSSSHLQTRLQYRRHLKALVWEHNSYSFMLSLMSHNLFRQIHAHCHCFKLHNGSRRTNGQVGNCINIIYIR